MKRFNFITIFPEIILSNLTGGVVGQAYKKGLFQVHTLNPRLFTSDVHQTVDDRPYGGGDGMIMLAEPLKQSILHLGENAGHRVYLSATGKPWKTSLAREWSNKHENITFVCGRYGGVDQRFINDYIDEEISIGDYIVSGGELPALILLDSIVRFMPQVLGHVDSAEKDSFSNDLLEAPLFTRPQAFNELSVPRVFTQGDHKKIDQTREALSLVLTKLKRPELLNAEKMAELPQALQLLRGMDSEELRACGLSPQDLIGN